MYSFTLPPPMNDHFEGQSLILFNCAEQYMMYYKALFFKDFKKADQILAASKPAHQKKLGRDVLSGL
jgi:predicted NAD-dependent protein-ADP-ribosyltransferase YbiA (DUF1768 family)